MPACCWPDAAPHECLMLNIEEPIGDSLDGAQPVVGKSSWEMTRRHEFDGLQIPFGAGVFFKR